MTASIAATIAGALIAIDRFAYEELVATKLAANSFQLPKSVTRKTTAIMYGRGKRLVEAMQRRNMTKQYALAVALGVNESTVSRWKSGGSISVDSAVLLCRTLDISLDWFLNGTGAIDAHKTLEGFAEAPTLYRAETSLDMLSQVRLAEFLDTVMSKPR